MNENAENHRLVQVGSRVEPELAAAVAELADAGDRSVSRQIRRAIREHVQRSEAPGVPPSPVAPAERRRPEEVAPAVELRPRAGEGVD
jgi:hypothetical protein